MARTDPTIYMRIPEALKEKLDTASNENHRSLTAEVVARLESSFRSVDADNAAGMLLEAQRLQEVSSSQAKVISLLGYSLMVATTATAQDSNDLKDFKSSLRDMAISLNANDIDAAMKASTEVAFGERRPPARPSPKHPRS